MDPNDPDGHLLHWAMTIIANVSDGRWSDQSAEWQGAAERWNAALDARRKTRQSDRDLGTVARIQAALRWRPMGRPARLR
jgi:hypothetical protein